MIGKNINRIRKNKGITLSELAEQSNVSKSYLSNLERNLNDNPSIQVIKKIADVLNVDFRLLIGAEYTSNTLLDKEWVEFIEELKQIGIEKEKLQELKTVIEFVKWQSEKEKS